MSHRRSNKSHKVPNVRLRPAPPVPRKPTLRDLPSADSGFDSDPDVSFVDSCPRPLRGVVLCATGISDKTTLFKQAIELGAQPLHDLTDKVTHLIALEPGSAKYKCALQNRLPIMHPSWIAECYDIWLKGDDVDIRESVRRHRLPIFSDVVLCVSGIEDIEKRTKIHKYVTQQGGSYVKNIERPVKVTHLLCSTGLDEMSEKMKYAMKFNERKEASICMVWEQWFWDSLKAQGRCDEDAYDVSKPCPVRQQTPEPQPAAGPSSLGDGVVEVPTSSAPSGLQDNDDEEEQMAAVKRVPAVTLRIWQDLLKPRGFELQEGKLIRSPSKSQAPPRIVPGPFESPSKNKGKARAVMLEDNDNDRAANTKPSVLSSFRRTQSFVPKPDNARAQKQPFTRVPTASSVLPAQGHDGAPIASSSRQSLVPPEEMRHLFHGKVFRVMGEARCQPVREAIERAGGTLVSEGSDGEADFIIVRLVSGSKLYRDEPDALERAKFRTECWLERCIFEERICAATDHVSFVPIQAETPINGSERISISFSGLDQSEACFVRRLTRALGMNIAPKFSLRTTHLLCPSRTGAKFDKAMEWRIPVVDMSWFTEITTTGVLPGDLAREINDDSERKSGPSRHSSKGEAYDVRPITDITNNDVLGDTLIQPAQKRSPNSSPLGDSDYLDFGQPNDLLCDPAPPAPIHTAKPDGPKAPFPADTTTAEPQMTLQELRQDMLTTQIRSSESPSPMKLPSRAPSKSPTKISEEATKVLQESISSLLGKRPSEEESTLPTIRSKRARPPSRTKSALEVPRPIPEVPENLTQSQPPASQSVREEISMLKAHNEGRGTGLRVFYEDPDQKSERLRLLQLVEGPPQPDLDPESQLAEDSVPMGSVQSTKRRRIGARRSVRAPGF